MRQKTFIKQTSLAILLYFICLALAVAIDLIFFKVKNMYHTPALAAIFAGWVYLGLIRKTKQFGAITCLGIFMSLFFFASGHFVLAFLPFISSSYSCLLIAVVVSFSWVKVGSRLVVFTNSDKGQQGCR